MDSAQATNEQPVGDRGRVMGQSLVSNTARLSYPFHLYAYLKAVHSLAEDTEKKHRCSALREGEERGEENGKRPSKPCRSLYEGVLNVPLVNSELLLENAE